MYKMLRQMPSSNATKLRLGWPTLVPLDAQPLEVSDNCLLRLPSGASLISILHTADRTPRQPSVKGVPHVDVLHCLRLVSVQTCQLRNAQGLRMLAANHKGMAGLAGSP